MEALSYTLGIITKRGYKPTVNTTTNPTVNPTKYNPIRHKPRIHRTSNMDDNDFLFIWNEVPDINEKGKEIEKCEGWDIVCDIVCDAVED